MRTNRPRRGELYRATLDPTVGTEIAKTRPASIVSNDLGNEYAPRVIVAPITSQRLRAVFRFEVLILPAESGLNSSSKVLLDQIRALDKRRIHGYIGALGAESMARVDQAIRLSLAV